MSFTAGGLALAIPASANAQFETTAPPAWQFEVGAFLSYYFGGKEPGRLGFSLETRELHARRNINCGDGPFTSVGMVQRLAMVGWDQFRLTVGARAGLDSRAIGAGGEFAGGFRMGRDPGPLMYLGVETAVANVAFARLAYMPRVDSLVGIGGGFPTSTMGSACSNWVAGRPLRREEQRLASPGTAFAGDGICSDPDSSEGAAALVWAERAAAEWASVPAFLELAAQLGTSGAPHALMARAYAAAAEESRHAVLSGAIAAALGGSPVEIAPALLVPRPAATGQAGLERLAVESFRDGCIGEEAAAAWAAEEAESARSPFVRMAERSIAADEAGHAALAWDVVAWTLAGGGGGVRSALVDAAAADAHEGPRVFAAATEDEASARDLSGFGCLPARSRGQIHRRRAEAARRQLHAII